MSAALYRLDDLRRIMLGATPPVFIVEVILRLTILYATLVIAMRLMGRRMASQLTRNELLALVSLAGAVGPSVQDPKRGLLPSIVSALVIVLVQRLYARLTLRHERLERYFQGDPAALVIDGRVQLPALRKNAISRQRLFAELRAAGVQQLGAVERMYLEPSGSFCLLRRATPTAGLSLIPEWDEALCAEQEAAENSQACFECGALSSQPAHDTRACSFCGQARWVSAIRA